MSELISVICTVRNGEKTISDTINSVLNQTYKNFEFIIIDDGSTDRTFRIVKEFVEKDSRIKLFNFDHIGRGAGLNKAIELCSGELIANIDADDLFHPQKLEFQHKLIKQNPDVFLISSETTLIYDDEDQDWENLKSNDEVINFIGSSILYRNSISHVTVLMNRDKLDEIGKYSNERKSLLDYDLWLRAYSKNYTMIKSNLCLAAKRIHKNQSFENKKRLKYTFDAMKLQINYILKSKKYWFYLFIPVINFIAAQLPFSVRASINKRIK